MSKEVSNEYMQPKNAGCPTKLLVKEQRTRMIIALQSDPRLDSTYWASLSLCAPPLSYHGVYCSCFMTLELRRYYGVLWACDAEEGWLTLISQLLFFLWCVCLQTTTGHASPPTPAHFPPGAAFRGPSRRGEITLADAQTDSSAPVNKRGLCATVTSH